MMIEASFPLPSPFFTITSDIIAGNMVALAARDGDIINKGGRIIAGGHLHLSASGDISNIGGGSIISKGSAELSARNIRNITETTKNGDNRNYYITKGAESSIKVASMLKLRTRGDVRNIGGSIEAGSLMLDVGGDFSSSAIELGEAVDHGHSDNYYRRKSVLFEPAKIEVAGDVQGFVAGDFSLRGSKIKSGGSVDLAIGGSSLIESRIASESGSSHNEYDVGNTTKKTSSSFHRDSLVEAGIEASGRIALATGGDQIYFGAKLAAGLVPVIPAATPVIPVATPVIPALSPVLPALSPVIPAHAGIQKINNKDWMPAFAGMTSAGCLPVNRMGMQSPSLCHRNSSWSYQPVFYPVTNLHCVNDSTFFMLVCYYLRDCVMVIIIKIFSFMRRN